MAELLAYGPHAFGVVALVVIWQVIVGPELREFRRELRALREDMHEGLSNLTTEVRTNNERVSVNTDQLRVVTGYTKQLALQLARTDGGTTSA